ncbi:MAG TPA: TRAP transporter large permease subunit [Afifellaceae bacterium]|nr:TRAP transporter large permease subunit [Afifellaceae bacterium]
MSEIVSNVDQPVHRRETAWERRIGLADDLIFYGFALVFFVLLSRYYVTGGGGPTRLVVIGVPLALSLAVLNDLRKGYLYPRLGLLWPHLLAAAYIGFSLYAIWYLLAEFDNIRIYRIASWNANDMIVGGGMTALIMEYTRRHYFALFVVIAVLILYTVYGYIVPGMFHHPGMRWTRVLSATSLEFSTGIFDNLAQLALTLIGSFILVLAALRAFGCIDSILHGASRIAVRSPQLLPQAAVIGSFGVAAVSGSGAANAATTGSATIPILIQAGFPRVTAAAVETASSLGGQIMPPLMGIAAFLMAEYLRVSYFEVVARGFAPAFIYFLGVAFSVYLVAARYYRRAVVPDVPPLGLMDKGNILAYLVAVCGLIYYMGVERRPAMTSAQNVFVILFLFLAAIFLFRSFLRRALGLRELARPFLRLIESFASITAELTMLLATLGVLTALFTVTGVPTKVGVLLMEGAGIHLALMVLVAFLFGYLVGMGLPVAPTYIITAVVIAPFMIRAGIEPWVVHFFAFFVAIFGELSPPTSVTAAVTSKIAEAPFVPTMMMAMLMCMPLMVMMGAVFSRPDLVVVPGLAQLPAFALILAGTLALSFAIQGRFSASMPLDIGLRLVLVGLAAMALFHPDYGFAALFAVAALVLVGLGIMMMRRMLAAQPA